MAKVPEKIDDKTLRLDVVFSRIDNHTSAVSGFPIKGSVIVHCPSETSYNSISLTINGQVLLRDTSGRSSFDPLKLEPITFYNVVVPIATSGKLPPGRNPLPFEVELPRAGVFESYMGMYIDVRYTASVELKRGALHRNVNHVANFSVINPGQAYDASNVHGPPIEFDFSPPEASKDGKVFRLRGRIDASRMDCSAPLTGWVEVISTPIPIRFIKLQLIRVEEAVMSGEKTGKDRSAREATEIQSVFVAQGDVVRAINADAANDSKPSPTRIPLFTIFPRNFTAPTLLTATYRVEYELNLEVTFVDTPIKVTQNLPIRLWRAALPPGVAPSGGVLWVEDDAPSAGTEW